MKSFWRVVKLSTVRLCILLLCSIQTWAATEKISPYFGIGSDAFLFEVQLFRGTEETILKFEPNIPGLSRIGISAYGFGASLSTRADAKELDTDKGESTFMDYQLNYHNLKWGIDLYAQNYEGFYLKNSSDFTTTQPYLLYPHLRFMHHGFMGRWAFSNDGFSVAGLLNQADEIKKTTGSYFLTGGVRYYKLDNDGSLLPTSIQTTNPDVDSLRRLDATTVNFGVGAGKYWVSSSKFFIGGVFDLIGTYGIYKYKLTTDDLESSYATLSYSIKAGAGYAGQKWRTGFSAYSDVTTLQAPDRAFIRPSATSFFIYVRYVF